MRLNHRLSPDPRYHFSTLVTRDWKAVVIPRQAPDREQPVASVGLLRRVVPPTAEIEVVAALLPREVHPSDWLELWLADLPCEVVDKRFAESPGGEVGEFLSVGGSAGERYVFRTSAVKDGNCLFAIQCRADERDYAAVQEEFLIAIANFLPINPTGQRYAEPLALYRFEHPVAGGFRFPSSWEPANAGEVPPGSLSVTLRNRAAGESRVAGQFNLLAIPRADADDEAGLLADYVDSLAGAGVTVERPSLERDGEPRIGHAEATWSSVLGARRNGVPMELRCCAAEHTSAWLLLTMLGPDRSGERDAQVINRRAFDIAVESLVFD